MMTKLKLTKIYLDTSVYGSYNNHIGGKAYYVRKFFDEVLKRRDLKIYYSSIVLKELCHAPRKIIQLFEKLNLAGKLKQVKLNNQILDLAYSYVEEGVLTEKSRYDAIHIACATFYKIDLMLTYDVKHMIKSNNKKGFNDVNIKLGFDKLIIISPNSVVEI